MAFRHRDALTEFSRRRWADVRVRFARHFWTPRVRARIGRTVWTVAPCLAAVAVGCFGTFVWYDHQAHRQDSFPAGHSAYHRYPEGELVHRMRHGPPEVRAEVP